MKYINSFLIILGIIFNCSLQAISASYDFNDIVNKIIQEKYLEEKENIISNMELHKHMYENAEKFMKVILNHKEELGELANNLLKEINNGKHDEELNRYADEMALSNKDTQKATLISSKLGAKIDELLIQSDDFIKTRMPLPVEFAENVVAIEIAKGGNLKLSFNENHIKEYFEQSWKKIIKIFENSDKYDLEKVDKVLTNNGCYPSRCSIAYVAEKDKEVWYLGGNLGEKVSQMLNEPKWGFNDLDSKSKDDQIEFWSKFFGSFFKHASEEHDCKLNFEEKKALVKEQVIDAFLCDFDDSDIDKIMQKIASKD